MEKHPKVVLLAGGKGTRLAEETVVKPKPMVEIGGKPIIWHIMKLYAAHGLNEFVVCLGYKGSMIKEYFLNYAMLNSDITVNMHGGTVEVHQQNAEDWKITLVDTGEDTLTGGRLKRIKKYIEHDPYFCMTYGDGVSDIDITKEIAFHKKHGKLVTIAGVRPMARFGALHMENGLVTKFQEKPDTEGGYINGGFFIIAPEALDTIKGDEILWEKEPLEKLASSKQLAAFTHDGFWQPMDTVRDRDNLQALWDSGKAPWKNWK